MGLDLRDTGESMHMSCRVVRVRTEHASQPPDITPTSQLVHASVNTGLVSSSRG